MYNPKTLQPMEAFIYDTVISKLLEMHSCPNFVIPYCTYRCSSFKKLLENTNSVAKEYFFDSDEVDFIIMENLPNTFSLKDWVNQNQDRSNFIPEIKKILLQKVYQIECLREMGVVHGDDHSENNLITTLPTEITIRYRINQSTVYTVKTRFLLRNFDYDRANITLDLKGNSPKGADFPNEPILTKEILSIIYPYFSSDLIGNYSADYSLQLNEYAKKFSEASLLWHQYNNVSLLFYS